MTAPILSETIPYPTWTTPRTIHQPIPIGVAAGCHIGVDLLNNDLLVAGRMRSGTTLLMRSMAAGLGHCDDAVTWAIDIDHGGGTFLPFLDSYLDGRVDRPMVDWMAATVEEASLMADAVLQIINTRMRCYRSLLREHNTNRLPVNMDIPQIVVMVSKLNIIGATRETSRLADKLQRIVRIGSPAGVSVVYETKRPTLDNMFGVPCRDFTAAAVLRPDDPEELALVFGEDGYSLNRDAVSNPGAGYIRAGSEGTPLPFQGYHTDYRMCDDIAARAAESRAVLDQASHDAEPISYGRRHDRLREQFGVE